MEQTTLGNFLQDSFLAREVVLRSDNQVVKATGLNGSRLAKLLSEMYLSERLSDARIATKLGLNGPSVFNARKRFGIPSRKSYEGHYLLHSRMWNSTSIQKQMMDGLMLGDGTMSYNQFNPGTKYYAKVSGKFSLKHCYASLDIVEDVKHRIGLEGLLNLDPSKSIARFGDRLAQRNGTIRRFKVIS